MPMPVDYAEDLVRNSKTIPQEVMAQLILLAEKQLPRPEDEEILDKVLYSPHIDQHDTTVLFTLPVFNIDLLNRHSVISLYRKLIPESVHSDPLTYDFTNATNLNFPQPNLFNFNWFNLNWAKRSEITIPPGNVTGTLNNYPLLILKTIPALIGFTADELRFARTDNSPLNYEIQFFNPATGLLIAYVSMPTITDNDILYVYYDNPSAVDAQNPPAVWDPFYTSVYHFQDDGKDSTDIPQDLTLFGTVQTPVAGKIGNGLNFGGTVNDYAIRNPYLGWPPDEFTIEFWVKSTGTIDFFINYFQQMGLEVAIAHPAHLFFHIFNQTIDLTIPTDDGLFHHIAINWRSSDGRSDLVIDGVHLGFITYSSGNTFLDGKSLVLGQDQDALGGLFDPSNSLDGIMDELRISSIFREVDYMITSHKNQNDPDSFCTVAAEEDRPFFVELTQFGGGAFTDGSSFIKVDDPIDALEIDVDGIMIACWAYLKPNGTESYIIDKAGTHFRLSIDTSNRIIFEFDSGGVVQLVSSPITTEGWIHIVATAKAGEQKLYIDKVLDASATEATNLNSNSFTVGIFAAPNGSFPMQDGEGISWISVILGFKGQAWVNDDFDGIRDVSDMDEIICFPFMQKIGPQPPMTSGLFVSGS